MVKLGQNIQSGYEKMRKIDFYFLREKNTQIDTFQYMNLMELYEGGKKSGMTRYIKLIVMVNLQMILKKKIVFLTMEKNTQIGNASTLQIIRL